MSQTSLVAMNKNLKDESSFSRAEYVEQWGHSPSIALLDPNCNIFSTPAINGAIGYRSVANNIIAFGNPVCAIEDVPSLTHAFHENFVKEGKSIIYISVSEPFIEWSLATRKGCALQVANEIILNPLLDPMKKTGKKASLLRNKYNQCIREGICVEEYTDQNPRLEKQMSEIAMKWQKARRGPQIYLLQIDIFKGRTNKRWFYAHKNGILLGMLMLNRVNACQGWVLNLLLLTDRAPTCTSEFLVVSTLTILRDEDCSFLSIGTVPAQTLGRVEGLGFLTKWIASKTFNIAKKIFHLTDRNRYWKKFDPHIAPSFVLFCKQRIGIRDVLSIMRALNVSL